MVIGDGEDLDLMGKSSGVGQKGGQGGGGAVPLAMPDCTTDPAASLLEAFLDLWTGERPPLGSPSPGFPVRVLPPELGRPVCAVSPTACQHPSTQPRAVDPGPGTRCKMQLC